MRNAFGSVVLISLLACDSQGGGATGTSSASPATTTTAATSASGATAGKYCDKAEALHTRLGAIDVKVSRVGLVPGITLPEGTDGMPFPVQSTVVIASADGYSVGGTRIASATELPSKVQLNNVLFAIGKDEKRLDRLVEGVRAFPPETNIYLLAAVPGAKREPAPASVKLDGSNDSERAVLLANALKKSIDGCEPVSKFFQTLATQDPDSRAPLLREKLPGLVDQCQCKVADDTADLFAYLLGGDAPVVAKRIVLSREASAPKLDLAKLDGQKLFDALPREGSPVRF